MSAVHFVWFMIVLILGIWALLQSQVSFFLTKVFKKFVGKKIWSKILCCNSFLTYVSILQPVLCYRWCADRWLLISTLIFFYKTATYIKRILISKLFKSTSGNNLPCQKMVDRYQYVDLNSFEIKINFVNVAVLEKNHKIDIGYHLSALQQ